MPKNFDIEPWREYLAAFDDYLAAKGPGSSARFCRAVARARMRGELAPRLAAQGFDPHAHSGKYLRGVVMGPR